MERPSGAEGANRRVGRGNRRTGPVQGRYRRGDEPTPSDPRRPGQDTGAPVGGNAANTPKKPTTSNTEGIVPAPSVDPTGRGRTPMSQAVAGANAGTVQEMLGSPGQITSLYYDLTGRNPQNGMYGQNMAYASVLSNLMDLVRNTETGDNNNYLDFVWEQLNNANTAGGATYNMSDILNGFAGLKGSLGEMIFADPALSGSDQVKRVSQYLGPLAQFTMTPGMARAFQAYIDYQGDRFGSGVGQGQNQDSFYEQMINNLRQGGYID